MMILSNPAYPFSCHFFKITSNCLEIILKTLEIHWIPAIIWDSPQFWQIMCDSINDHHADKIKSRQRSCTSEQPRKSHDASSSSQTFIPSEECNTFRNWDPPQKLELRQSSDKLFSLVYWSLKRGPFLKEERDMIGPFFQPSSDDVHKSFIFKKCFKENHANLISSKNDAL